MNVGKTIPKAEAAEALRQVVTQLGQSADTLAAVAAALAANTGEAVLDQRLARHVNEVVRAAGVDSSFAAIGTSELKAMLAQIRTFAFTNSKMISGAARAGGWAHDENELLEAAGDATSGFALRLKTGLAERLNGLQQRLNSPTASMLEVGTGVGALAIEMARNWPSLRIVGIDPLPQALAIASKRVKASGFAERIELRQQHVEAIEDNDAFDLASLPSLFIPPDVFSAALDRVYQSLRRGGWLLVPALQPGTDLLANALGQMRAAMFGGIGASAREMNDRLSQSGFADVRTLPSSATSLTCMLAGRRAV